MGRKSNILWVVIPIIGIAIFLVWLLMPYPNKIRIELAPARTLSTQPPSGSGILAQGAISVTPATVQDVVATLTRPESYTANYNVTLYWRTGSEKFPVSLKAEAESMSVNGITYSYGEREQGILDSLAMLPTYEDILKLEPEDILEASYTEYEDEPYICVRFNGLMYVHEYYVSIQSGILEYAKKYDGDTIVYSADIVK